MNQTAFLPVGIVSMFHSYLVLVSHLSMPCAILCVTWPHSDL